MTAPQRRRPRTQAADPPPSPADLDVKRIELPDGELAIFEFPIGAPTMEALTRAECEVLAALLRGQSNAAIAAQRSVKPRTIANQVASVFRKLGVHSRGELAAHWLSRLRSG